MHIKENKTKKHICSLFTLFLLLLSVEVFSSLGLTTSSTSYVFAQTEKVNNVDSSAEAERLYESFVGKELVEEFNAVRLSLSKNEYSSAYSSLDNLKSLSLEHGYSNIPSFSYYLIRAAKKTELSLENRKRLLEYAEKLSPDHPGVLFSLSSATSVLGIKTCLSYLWKGFTEISGYPLSLASFLARIFVLAVCALFLTLVLVTFVFLMRNCGEIYVTLATKFPRNIRGIAAFMIFPLILFSPLLLPPLLSLVIWIVFMSVLLGRMKFLCFSGSFLMIAIIYGLPISSGLIKTAESPISIALENINQGAYSPRDQEYLNELYQKNDKNLKVEILIARSLHERGNLLKARNIYNNVLKDGELSKSLKYIVKMNKGAIHFSEGDTARAFEVWEGLYDIGWKEYELLYNLSLAAVATFKQEKYDFYFSLAQERYPGKLQNLPLETELSPVPLLARMPQTFFIDLIKTGFNDKFLISESKFKKLPDRDAVIGGHSDNFYLSLAFVLFMLGMWQSLRSKKSYRYRGSLVTERMFLLFKKSSIWRFFPFGYIVLMQKELIFIVGLFLFILTLLIGLITPIRLLSEQFDAFYVFGFIASALIVVLNIYPAKMARKVK